jgi:methionyl-tRNA formyltransferase
MVDTLDSLTALTRQSTLSDEKVILLGSKSIGFAIAKELRATLGAIPILTFDDRDDSRSALNELVGIGATVLAQPKHAGDALDDASVVVVAGWYWMLPDTVTTARRTVGFHNSLLPKYRGGSPLVWAMIRGEPEVGVSMFEIGHEMDAGPIWGQARTIIEPDETVSDVLIRLQAASVELVRNALPDLLSGGGHPVPQDEAAATFCAQRQESDGQIDWTLPARRVHDFVRAQSRPYPGAFTALDGRRVRVWRTRVVDRTYVGTPGQIVRAGVICGDDRLVELLEVEGSTPRAGRFTSGS